jgi:uncharacterized protein YecE (DUF72 family)
MARALVGTSGWGYGFWRGPFFPMEVPAKHHLEYYASQFDTVELNCVFWERTAVLVKRNTKTFLSELKALEDQRDPAHR